MVDRPYGEDPGDVQAVPGSPGRGEPHSLTRWALARSLLHRLMPAKPLPTEHETLRAELVLAFNLIFVGIAMVVSPIIFLVIPLPPANLEVAELVIPGLMVGLVLAIASVRILGAIHLAAHITVTTIFATLVASSILMGGIDSSVFCLWVLVPIVGGLLSGRQACGLWGAAVICFSMALFAIQQAGWVNVERMDVDTYRATVLINMTIACVAAIAAVGSYETINMNLRRTIAMERAKFRYQAGHDPLTGLPNRRLFLELQAAALRRADRSKRKVGLFIIDLDDFKSVNDQFGHASGDRVLQAVATRLRKFTRVTDAVARLGGDEFAVLVELLDCAEDADRFAQRLQQELSGHVPIDDRSEVPLSASVGIALYPDDGENVDEIHEAADSAMYAAKNAGGGHYRLSALDEPGDDFPLAG